MAMAAIQLSDSTLSDFTDTGSLPTAKKLTAVDKGVTKITIDEPADSLVNVNVSKNELTSCLFLENCTEVTTVNLSYNKIEKTKPLRVLSKLRVLNISHNLVSKSVFIAKLKGLQALILNDNNLTTLPALDMPQLATLLVSKNQLTELDTSKLPNLKKLSFNSNKLSAFPNFSRNVWVESVSGMHNLIEKIPKGHLTAKHTKLKLLELNFNQIKKFKSLEPLNSVRLPRLSLYGNPLTEKEEYRVKVTLICPSLHTLDGQSATASAVRSRDHQSDNNENSAEQTETSAETDVPVKKKKKKKMKVGDQMNVDNTQANSEKPSNSISDSEIKNKRAADKISSDPADTNSVAAESVASKKLKTSDSDAVDSQPDSEKPAYTRKQKKTPRVERAKSGVVKIKMLRKETSSKLSGDVAQLFDASVSVGGGQSSW